MASLRYLVIEVDDLHGNRVAIVDVEDDCVGVGGGV